MNTFRNQHLKVFNPDSIYLPTKKIGKTVFGPLVTDTEFGSLLVTNCAALSVESGASVEFGGDWKVTDDAVVSFVPGSSVTALGSGISTLTGLTSFYDFTCTTPGKTLQFGTDGSCFGVQAGGTLTLTGEEESPIVLRSVAEGTAWPMDFASGAVADITYVDVGDSANSGATVVANKSVDSGNNTGWKVFASWNSGRMHGKPGSTARGGLSHCSRSPRRA